MAGESRPGPRWQKRFGSGACHESPSLQLRIRGTPLATATSTVTMQ